MSDLKRLIQQAMHENMLDELYVGYVEELLLREDDAWRSCCGRDCEPCMRQLMRVVDRVRQLQEQA
ncbi:MAG: hypothetical protein H6718_18700 [Polyangiaceae bacterium]|nr:hypothetical protein [Myxococcales bacterium]MCB9587437.1 hypothetical protein [Polyangiaceae bacterium]MCB9605766.1 hypothetical protein [Polyangiaceae bacterium]